MEDPHLHLAQDGRAHAAGVALPARVALHPGRAGAGAVDAAGARGQRSRGEHVHQGRRQPRARRAQGAAGEGGAPPRGGPHRRRPRCSLRVSPQPALFRCSLAILPPLTACPPCLLAIAPPDPPPPPSAALS
eukprot:643144-Prymnesium_polylepis.1